MMRVEYTANLRIILCANSTSRIIGPIRSRCLLLRVGAPSEEEVSSRFPFSSTLLHTICADLPSDQLRGQKRTTSSPSACPDHARPSIQRQPPPSSPFPRSAPHSRSDFFKHHSEFEGNTRYCPTTGLGKVLLQSDGTDPE